MTNQIKSRELRPTSGRIADGGEVFEEGAAVNEAAAGALAKGAGARDRQKKKKK